MITDYFVIQVKTIKWSEMNVKDTSTLENYNTFFQKT